MGPSHSHSLPLARPVPPMRRPPRRRSRRETCSCRRGVGTPCCARRATPCRGGVRPVRLLGRGHPTLVWDIKAPRWHAFVRRGGGSRSPLHFPRPTSISGSAHAPPRPSCVWHARSARMCALSVSHHPLCGLWARSFASPRLAVVGSCRRGARALRFPPSLASRPGAGAAPWRRLV